MLAPCRDCGERISRRATQCPHCGATGPSWSLAKLAFIATVVLFAITTLAQSVVR